jgi:hypothetical protein
LLTPPATAQAFTQTWSGAANYRASADFLPAGSRISVGGKSCSSPWSFNVELVKTRASVHVWTSPNFLSDGQFRGVSYPGTVSRGTAYYMRWRLAYKPDTSGCQGVQAVPTQ